MVVGCLGWLMPYACRSFIIQWGTHTLEPLTQIHSQCPRTVYPGLWGHGFPSGGGREVRWVSERINNPSSNMWRQDNENGR